MSKATYLQTFRLRDLIKPSFDLWVFSWLLGLITVVSIVGLLMVSGWFLTATAMAGMVALGAHSFNYVFPAGVIRIMAISRTAGRYGELMVAHSAIFDLLGVLRLTFFRTLSKQPLTNQYASLQSSQQMHRLVKDINVLDEFNLRVISPWLMSLLMLSSLTILLLLTVPSTTSVKSAFVLLMILVLIIPAIMAYIGIKQAKNEAHLAEQRRQSLLSPLTVITQLLLWKQWKQQTQDFIKHDQALHDIDWQSQKRRSFTMFFMQLVFYSLMILLLLAVVWSVQMDTSSILFSTQELIQLSQTNSTVDIAIVFALILGLFGIQEVVLPLGQHYQSLGNSLAAKQRLNELLGTQEQTAHTKVEISNSATTSESSNYSSSNNSSNNYSNSSSGSNASGSKNLPLPAISTEQKLVVTLQQVSCKLPNAIVGAENVNVTITSGIPLIISGESGCGKSTLLQTLANELEIQSGEVRFNNELWQDYNWEDQLGYLGQQLDIFDQTLADNLRLGNPDASDEALFSVLTKVSLIDWVESQPQGLNTHLGEYGTAISGGQARRIALARLLLKPRRVLLLDEPFAGLDKDSQNIVWEAVTQHQKHAILIIVSHHHHWKHLGEVAKLKL